MGHLLGNVEYYVATPEHAKLVYAQVKDKGMLGYDKVIGRKGRKNEEKGEGLSEGEKVPVKTHEVTEFTLEKFMILFT